MHGLHKSWVATAGLLVASAAFGCRSGTPAEWTMERLAMSEAWHEQSEWVRGEDASYQEGWRSGYRDGRTQFAAAWTNKSHAEFEALISDKREEAQANWRRGYSTGIATALQIGKKHQDHTSLFQTSLADIAEESYLPETSRELPSVTSTHTAHSSMSSSMPSTDSIPDEAASIWPTASANRPSTTSDVHTSEPSTFAPSQEVDSSEIPEPILFKPDPNLAIPLDDDDIAVYSANPKKMPSEETVARQSVLDDSSTSQIPQSQPSGTSIESGFHAGNYRSSMVPAASVGRLAVGTTIHNPFFGNGDTGETGSTEATAIVVAAKMKPKTTGPTTTSQTKQIEMSSPAASHSDLKPAANPTSASILQMRTEAGTYQNTLDSWEDLAKNFSTQRVPSTISSDLAKPTIQISHQDLQPNGPTRKSMGNLSQPQDAELRLPSRLPLRRKR